MRIQDATRAEAPSFLPPESPRSPRPRGACRPPEGTTPRGAHRGATRAASARRGGAKRSLWAYTTGKYGFTVRVFERADRPTLTLAYWDAAAGKIRKHGLGHNDRAQAADEAERVAQRLRVAARASDSPVAVPAPVPVSAAGGHAAGGEGLTIDQLFTQYAVAKVDRFRAPGEYRRRLALWRGFFEAEAVILVADIDQTVLDRFADQRRHGDLHVPGLKLRPPAPPPKGRERRVSVVSERTIGADVEFLSGVFTWATRRKVGGIFLLSELPVVARRHRTPDAARRRPLATEEDHRALIRVADRVDSAQRLFGCFLRLLHDLGWRVTGLCHVRASDLDLGSRRGQPYGAVRKNPLVDKEEVEAWVPLSRHSRATVARVLRRRGISPGAPDFLFPAPRTAGRPWSRFHARDLLERAEEAAGVAHVGGTHAWRRKWATERKAHPEADLMHAGGWRDPRTLQKAYTRPDAQSTYAVVSKRTGVVHRGD